jgi:hypothetical protein
MSVTITTTHAWPATLPLPSLEYDGAASVPTIVSTGSSAKNRRRSRWRTPYAILNVKWTLTEAQLDTFLTFWSDTLGNGAAQFTIELRYPKNSSLDTWIAQFVGDIEISPDDNMQSVGSMLQLVSKTTLPDAALLV